MRAFFDKIFRRIRRGAMPAYTGPRDDARYAAERDIAQNGDRAARLGLAGDSRTHQEILFYLATHDDDPAIRQAVARNTATPIHASQALAKDRDADVRLLLAGRLVGLLPELSQDKHSQLYAYCVQALGTLALDEVLKIRKALSTALQDNADTPPKIAGQLARDVEREVSEPILRFCAALSDTDLLDILADHPASWAVQAIAGRRVVSDKVSRAVIRTRDSAAGVILLQNEGAQIAPDVLRDIVAQAHRFPEWQKPSALRKNLPPELAQELARFADASVRDVLLQRSDLDGDVVADVAETFARRLAYADAEARSDDPPEIRVRKLAKKKMLDEAVIADALAMRDRDFVVAALAYLAKTDTLHIERIFAMKAPKPIVALCWHVGLPMRLALKLQQELGQVPPPELMYARGGLEYPMSESAMLWQLDFLDLKSLKKHKKPS